jgi:transposase
MNEKMDKEHIQELREMVKEKKPEEPVEEVLTKFCERHAVSLETCRLHYDRLMKEGQSKKKTRKKRPQKLK